MSVNTLFVHFIEIVPAVPVKALSEYWEHPDQEGYEPAKPISTHLPRNQSEVNSKMSKIIIMIKSE